MKLQLAGDVKLWFTRGLQSTEFVKRKLFRFMKNSSTLVHFLLFFFVLSLPLRAEPVLPHLFSDHMVLPRETEIRVWGWADPGESVYKEGVFVGYRHFDRAQVKPLFPFGYRLSYTTFQYSDLKVTPFSADLSAPITVSFNVKNTRSREGAEVAELYVGDSHSSVARPVKELKGFAKCICGQAQPSGSQSAWISVRFPFMMSKKATGRRNPASFPYW
jgi:hypothetical protein